MPELTDPAASGSLHPRFRDRLDASHAELLRLSGALAKRPHPEERAILAGALLGTAGYLMRRSRMLSSLDKNTSDVEQVLSTLPKEDVNAWLADASASGLKMTLKRAADAAFEAGLSEDEKEREDHTNQALEGLAERERLAGALQALGRWEQLQGPLEERASRRRDALTAEVGRIDTALRSSSIALAHLNDERRAERDLLEENLRADAWWYSHHAENNDLSAMILGASPSTLAQPARVTEALKATQTPPSRHLSSEELWDFDLGLLGEDQRAWVHRHTSACADCRRALQALSEGDEAINEALGLPAARPQAERETEVVFEHPLFRVLALQNSKKPRIILEEKKAGALSSALPMAGIKPRRLRNGYEFQLLSRPQGTLRLQVVLATGEKLSVPVGLPGQRFSSGASRPACRAGSRRHAGRSSGQP